MTKDAESRAEVTLEDVKHSRQVLSDLIEEFDELAAPQTSRYFGDVSRAASHVLYRRWQCHAQLARRYKPADGRNRIRVQSELDRYRRILDESDLVFREFMMTWLTGESISVQPERFYQSASKIILQLKNEENFEESLIIFK